MQTWHCHYIKFTAWVTVADLNLMCPLALLCLPEPAGALRASNACIMELAKRAASSLLPKFSPHTCLGSRHWWKFGVAWLYFIPLIMGQLITTWQEHKKTFDFLKMSLCWSEFSKLETCSMHRKYSYTAKLPCWLFNSTAFRGKRITGKLNDLQPERLDETGHMTVLSVCVCTLVLYLLVGLHFTAHHSVGVGCGVVIDLDPAERRTVRSRRHPSLAGVIVQHDCRPHLADTGLTVGGREDEMQSTRKDHMVEGNGEPQKKFVV